MFVGCDNYDDVSNDTEDRIGIEAPTLPELEKPKLERPKLEKPKLEKPKLEKPTF
jgi:hypothetical protein